MGPQEAAGPVAKTVTPQLYDNTVSADGLCMFQAGMSSMSDQPNYDTNIAMGTPNVSNTMQDRTITGIRQI